MKKIYISGISFLVFAIVFSAKYISASILLAKSDSLSVDMFRDVFDVLPLELTIIYIISFIVGIVFLILGIKEKQLDK
ncbi:hypothetical protein [Bacillus sp. WP8]|nr:hypothetical protein [Bacillus sp. WP8]AAB71486.1 ORF1 [Bacillus pumilus]